MYCRFVKKMEDAGSPCMFLQCVQNIIILCLCSFEAATLQITVKYLIILINLKFINKYSIIN